MADAEPNLGLGHAGDLAPRTPSFGPSGRTSAEDIQSQDGLLSRNTIEDNSEQMPEASVPDAPPRVQEVPAENPTQATNRRLVSLKPKVIKRKVPNEQPDHDDSDDLDDLNFWPTILQWKAVTFLVLLYFPSIVGTVTVMFFHQTVRESLRMVPFISMADQDGGETCGAEHLQSVGGSWFPWQSITTTPKRFISIFSLLCQFVASFIISLKVALFAITKQIDKDTNEVYWILTVRFYPAVLLIVGYAMMVVYTLFISWKFRGRSTGLKWNPESIADYTSLFANCNALKYFDPLELQHHLRPKDVMLPNRFFRLGYWTRVRDNPLETDIVYGIGKGFSAHTDTGHLSQQQKEPLGRPWQQVIAFRNTKPPPKPVDQCNRPYKACAHGIWPNCEHYPYNYNPGVARWTIALASLLPISALALSSYALIIQLPNKGFSFPNNLKVPSKFHYGFGNSNYYLPPIDPADPNSTVLLWALMFRSTPTYIASIFTSTIVAWIDLNVRFTQPFRNMLGTEPKESLNHCLKRWVRPLRWRRKASSANTTNQSDQYRTAATASESILLAYITVSPLQVPLTAWDRGHYRVCIYSTLNALSPLFPIFVGGLLTVTPSADYERVNFSFSLSAYIGVMVSLVLYSFLLPASIPSSSKLLPRQLYSLADLMALCHESKFLASPYLNIAKTPSKQHMEAQLLLTDDRFLFGEYRGRDGHKHIGFDVAATQGSSPRKPKILADSVDYVHPEGFTFKLRRAVTFAVEEGRKAGRTMSGKMTRNGMNPFVQPHSLRPGEEIELPIMSGGLVRAEVSGSETQQVGNKSRAKPVGFNLPPTPHN